MNTYSLRWLFVAVASIALAVTAILNANELWLSAARFLLVVLIGVAGVSVVVRGRDAPFALGFVVLSAIAYWLEPSLDLNYFSKGVADVATATALLRVCLGIALGCIGGVVCSHLAAEPARSRLTLSMWLSVVALFVAATIAAGIVKSDRLVAEANAAKTPTVAAAGYGPPRGGAGYGSPTGGAGYWRSVGGAGYGRSTGDEGYGVGGRAPYGDRGRPNDPRNTRQGRP